ncbi:MAG: glycosyltransferase [Pseudomonadota bacterium]
MNVLWFVSAISQEGGQLTSPLASVRLRCIEPLKGMQQLGEKLNVRLAVLGPNMQLDPAFLATCDAAIIGKTMADLTPLLDVLERLRVPIVVDICDDPYEKEHLKAAYEKLIRRADLICAASGYLAGKVRAASGKDVRIIDDVVEYDAQTAITTPRPGSRLRLCWFGQASNLPPLLDQLAALASLGFATVQIDIATNITPAVADRVKSAAGSLPGLELVLHAWSREVVPQIISRSDIVLIPVASREWAKAKTANRLMTALQLGRPCVAGVIPSYQEFADYVCLDNDMAAGVQALLTQWEAQPGKIRQGQAYIRESYSAAGIARQWLAAIRQSSALRQAIVRK